MNSLNYSIVFFVAPAMGVSAINVKKIAFGKNELYNT